ncbi:hypothetical protein SCHPADRAFT_299262 [Schizopora paradoxa]|uniref:Association with the SNF1 complex (ASC) domain-containing protein n=1 Tax=Schizopora paradoxa TaxID=27342 RepID=A0A0H2RS00_9AGAM|nr:hypothetical protein SCHPADRAFT_299262 [Schizopora paradoxa]
MGNTSSTAKHPHSLPLDSPARSHSRRSRSTAPQTPASSSSARTASPSPRSPSVAPPPSPAPDAQQQGTSSTGQQSQSQSSSTKQRLPHRSLRTKKKSLELPDLALALTSTTPSTQANPAGASGASAAGQASAVSGPYRRPQASSPIAIPATPAGIPLLPGEQQDRLRTIPTNVVAAQQLPMAEAIVQSPPAPTGRGRAVNHHMRGAPLQYNSTRSFAGAYASATGQQGQQQQPPSFAARSQQHGGFVPEDIHSSIPLALRKAESTGTTDSGEAGTTDAGVDAASADEVPMTGSEGEVRRLVPVHILWRGGGKQVFLTRASDENWKGRQLMDHEENTDTWSTWVSLPPGTHHIRFLVDGVSQTATDLPTTVDDNGSLANYVAVPISGYTPPTTTAVIPPPVPSASTSKSTGGGNSFFADAGGSSASLDGNSSVPGDPTGGGKWTDKVPWQLECAAEEEEQWLAHGQSQRPPAPAPQHPHAPALPRHLEKLIMNQRPPGMPSSSHSSTGRHHGSHHGSGVRLFNTPHASMGPRVPSQLPVTTASGTNLSGSTSHRPSSGMQMTSTSDRDRTPTTTRIDHHSTVGSITAVADDGSVLPVPSHVVLHHLGTSAIRNGVLAVADTVRYRKKYITTIYYKPT